MKSRTAWLVSLALVVPAGTSRAAEEQPLATSDWEFKAVALSSDETAVTQKLNALAADGWELAGPLGNGLAAFKRSAQFAAARNELAKFQGEWKSGNQTLIIRGDRWRWGNGNFTLEEFKENRIKIVSVSGKLVSADMLVEEGERQGQVCKAIFRLDGDTLQYCGSYGTRPTGFDDPLGYAVDWKRSKN